MEDRSTPTYETYTGMQEEKREAELRVKDKRIM